MCKCQKEAKENKRIRQANKEQQEKLDKLIKNNLMDDKFRNSTFENWDFKKGTETMYNLGLNYAENFKDCKDKSLGFLIHGKPGNGKTYLSFCIANKLLQNFVPVIAASINSILDKLKDNYKFGNEAGEDFLNKLKKAELLILDDLGAEVHSERNISTIYNIIDARYRQGKPLIVTTNLDIKDLGKIYGIRTEDRILEMCTPVEYIGESIRAKNAKENISFLKKILYRKGKE